MPSRRQFLGAAGVTSLAGLAGCRRLLGARESRPAATERQQVTDRTRGTYELLTIPAGEREQFIVTPDRPLENTLIDITADGADIEIRPRGAGWRIRNVGVTGQFGGGFSVIVEGHGRFENVYFGDGTVAGVNGGSIWHNNAAITGPVIYDRFHIAGTTNNGVYGAPTALSMSGNPVHYRNCYFDSCQGAQLKIGSPEQRSTMYNCVVRTDRAVTPNTNGRTNTRGVWALHDRQPDGTRRTTHSILKNCDIKGSISHQGKGLVTLENTRWEGTTTRPQWVFGDSAGKPDLSPPEGCPMSAKEAALNQS